MGDLGKTRELVEGLLRQHLGRQIDDILEEPGLGESPQENDLVLYSRCRLGLGVLLRGRNPKRYVALREVVCIR